MSVHSVWTWGGEEFNDLHPSSIVYAYGILEKSVKYHTCLSFLDS